MVGDRLGRKMMVFTDFGSSRQPSLYESAPTGCEHRDALWTVSRWLVIAGPWGVQYWVQFPVPLPPTMVF